MMDLNLYLDGHSGYKKVTKETYLYRIREEDYDLAK